MRSVIDQLSIISLLDDQIEHKLFNSLQGKLVQV